MLDKKFTELLETQISDWAIRQFLLKNLDRPATLGDGIKKLNEKDRRNSIRFYEDSQNENKILKFVPASGAASRMFKELYSFMNTYKGSEEDYMKLTKDSSFKNVLQFFQNIEKYAFYYNLSLILNIFNKLVLEYLLTEKGLNYGNLPKGLLKFHNYSDSRRTPVEEHLVEGAHYAISGEDHVFLHFTVSPEHEMGFKRHIKNVIPDYSKHMVH